MKAFFPHELILNHITHAESYPQYKNTWEDYKQMAYLYLNRTGRHLFEDDILSHYSSQMTLEKLFTQDKERFIQGMHKERNGKREKTWYDLWGTEEITREEPFFDFFFACKLRHVDLLDIDDFLNFHLDYSFEGDAADYLRFLVLVLRKHDDRLFNPKIVETVKEWLKSAETKYSGAVGEKDFRVKGRIERKAGDGLTSLTLNQTALLIPYLQAAKIILQGDYLNNTQAGKGLHILTGYSAHSMRQQLGTRGMVEGERRDFEGIKYEDYKDLHKIILELAALIEKDFRKK